MKTAKCLTGILLCIAMLLTMTACGQSDSTVETTAEETTAVETTSPADSYLAMAEDLVAQKKYDSAIDVLNQAKASISDPRLDAMIAEIAESRRVFLDLEFTVNSDYLMTEEVHVHNVTAEVLEDTVRYDVEYTAPEGMFLQVAGTELNHCWDYMTPGGEGQFSFETDKAYACDHLGNLTVLFKYDRWNYAQLNIISQWPGDEAQSLVQIPVTTLGTSDGRINLATVRAVGEDLLHFHIEFTTPMDQQYYAGLSFAETGEDTFFTTGVAAGDDSVSLMVDRAEMETIDAIYVNLFSEEQWGNQPAFALRSGDYTLPQASVSQDVQEVSVDGKELAVEKEKGKKLKLESILVQKTSAGNLYTLNGDFSACTSGTAYCGYGNLAYTVTALVNTPEQLQYFVPAEYLTRAVSLGVECWGQDGYMGWISLPFDFVPASASVLYPEKTADTAKEESIPGQVVQYPHRNVTDRLNHSKVEIFGVTETLLENGNLRYVVDFQATPGMYVNAFAPPDGELYQRNRLQETSGRRESFAFEVEKSAMDQIEGITVSFWLNNDDGNYWVFLEKNWYVASVTDGNPVGEEQTIKVKADSKVKVHSLKAQQLDNGFVRFTMEYTTTKGRGISFFNQPNNDHFIYLMDNAATGSQDTYVVDVPKADVDAVSEIVMKFYKPDYSDHVYAEFKAPRF